jgi:asparagine synthase (glutamine-hydrolysing)
VSGIYKGEPNWTVASRFLLEGRLEGGNDTFYKDIHEVPSGTVFEVDMQGSWIQRRYWSLSAFHKVEANDPASSYAALLEDSVRLRLRSDVPVGVSLSGGLDSTSIICIAASLNHSSRNGNTERLKAYSYISSEFDESSYIMATIEQTRAQLRQVCKTPLQLWDNLSNVIWYHDEPVHSLNALIGFEIMRLASSDGIKVMLNGQGADETLAGYFSYFRNYWNTLFLTGEWRKTWQEICRYTNVHGGDARRLFWAGVRRLSKGELHRFALYRKLAEQKHRRARPFWHWFSPGFSEQFRSKNTAYVDGALDPTLMRAVERRPLPLYLRIEDRNSMAHSIEARLPFLDYRLVALAFQLTAEWKMNGPWNKYVLREAMRHRIPELVRTRNKKMGFPIPVKEWLASDLYEPVQDLLSSRTLRERGVYNVSAIRRDVELHREGKLNIASHLLKVIQFEIWSKLFFDSQPKSHVRIESGSLESRTTAP